MAAGNIFIGDLSKADVLAALYNASKPQGMGFLHYDPTPMTSEQAKEILEHGKSFDYLAGRVMKVDLSKDEFNPWGYNRDNGIDAAENVIRILRDTKNVVGYEIQKMHEQNTTDAAEKTMAALEVPTSFEKRDRVAVMHLGMDEFKSDLEPKLKKIIEKKSE